jgi:hypothetical protein
MCSILMVVKGLIVGIEDFLRLRSSRFLTQRVGNAALCVGILHDLEPLSMFFTDLFFFGIRHTKSGISGLYPPLALCYPW